MENNEVPKGVIVDYENYKNLPLAVYVTASSGEILRYNEGAKKLLRISSDITKPNIENYYNGADERRQLFSELELYEHGKWSNIKYLNFKVGNERLNVKFHCKVYKEDKNISELLCIVIQTSAFDMYKQFEDQVPVGFFQISENNNIIHSNEKFREILGVTEEELKGFNIINIFSIQQLESLRNTARLKTSTGSIFTVFKIPIATSSIYSISLAVFKPITQKYSFILCNLFCLNSILRIIRAMSCPFAILTSSSLGKRTFIGLVFFQI